MINKLDYSKKEVPENYTCKMCEAHGVRLYRQYQTFLDHIDLLCTKCALEDQKQTELKTDPPHTIHNIGWLVAAVPTIDTETFWGYTSVPQEGVVWWDSLPMCMDFYI